MLRSSCSLLSGSGPPPRIYSVVFYSVWWLYHVRETPSAAATVTRTPSFVSSSSRFCVRRRTTNTTTVVLPPALDAGRDGSSAAVKFMGGERFRMLSLRSENRRHPDGGGDVAMEGSPVRSASRGLARVLGHGDFAGLTANFHWPSGDLMEIPQHLVPKAMLEWGQAPTCLEVLTSEFDDEGGNEKLNMSSPSMTRQTITVLPSVGCAVDNLETMKSTIQTFEVCSVLTAAWQPTTSDDETGWPVRVTTYWPANHVDRRRIVVEATFPIARPLLLGVVGNFDSEWDGHRVRVSVPLEVADDNGVPSLPPASPVSITCERMVSEESSRGTLADGGGLDGQSVSRMLGPFLRHSYDAFKESANDPSTPIADYVKRLQESSIDRDRAKEELEMLALPCNTILSLSRGIEDFQIYIGHVDASTTSGIATDTVESFVYKILQIRVPLMKRNHSDETTSLDPTTFEFAAQVDLTSGDNAR